MFEKGHKFGKHGAQPGAGRPSKQVVADKAAAMKMFEERLAKSFGKYFDTMDKVARGIKVKKFYPPHHPTRAGKVYFEREYDTKVLCWLGDRFIPPARQALDVNLNHGWDQLMQELAEEARLKKEEARKTIEVKALPTTDDKDD